MGFNTLKIPLAWFERLFYTYSYAIHKIAFLLNIMHVRWVMMKCKRVWISFYEIYKPIMLLVKRDIFIWNKKVYTFHERRKKKLFFISCLQLKQWHYHSFISLPLVMLMMKFIILLWMNWTRHQRHHNTLGNILFNKKSSLSIRK